MEWKQNIFKPILTNNVQKWRKGLDRWQILAIEGVCREAFAHSSYPPSEIGGAFEKWVCSLPVYAYASAARVKRAMKSMGVRLGRGAEGR